MCQLPRESFDPRRSSRERSSALLTEGAWRDASHTRKALALEGASAWLDSPTLLPLALKGTPFGF